MSIYQKCDIPDNLQHFFQPAEMGLEKTHDEFVANLVEVCHEIKRVLKDTGTFWLNLGDSYSGSGKGPSSSISQSHQDMDQHGHKPYKGIPSGNLIGIPWRVALALQNDGWILRSDIIWSKNNPMPESVKNRPTKSHEYIFLLTKNMKYFYDYESVQEKASSTYKTSDFIPNSNKDKLSATSASIKNRSNEIISGYRNKRSVWTIPTQPMKESHFATFPLALIDPCVKAGCPEGGIVLDPFSGMATTGIAAIRNKCKYIGIELSEKYYNLSIKRLKKEWYEHNKGFFPKQYRRKTNTDTIEKQQGFDIK